MELVTGALGSLIPKVKDLLMEEYKLQTGVRDQVRSLDQELESAHAMLRKMAMVRPDQLDELAKIWAREVREASYDMEDILDTFLVRVEGSHNPSDKEGLLKRLREKITGLLKKSNERHKIAGAIEKITKNLQEVTERRVRYTVDNIVAKPAASSQTVDPRLAAMYTEASEIIGIDKSSADLISMLLPKEEDESDKKLKIVSVVGVGGLGKTTLAKAVYDKLKSQFGYGAFVPVGQDPDLKKVLRDILIDLDKEKYTRPTYTNLDERQLINELRDFLQTKRYFIVIDDVWDLKSWNPIRSALGQKNSGSRVIKTTRNLEVTCSDEVYQLGALTHEISKKLFYMRLGGEDKCLVASEKILHKCGGVPLAIITMASLLVGKSREYWLQICSTPGFYHGRDKEPTVDDTMWILSLSYHDLPSHLKTCLLYLSVYPEDYKIQKDLLIWKWVAEGFIEKKAGRSMFQLGEEYFHQLINRSMIQGVESKFEGIILGCRVHDMVLDLIRGLSYEENFITVLNKDGGSSSQHKKVRRLAHHKRIPLLDQSHPDSHREMTQLRSFVAHGCDIRGWVLHPSIKLLRVLALEMCTSSGNEKYDDRCSLEHLGNLVHLRYLGLRGTKVRELPEAIGALKLLQTLDLENTTRLEVVKLPTSVSLLTRLICLRCDFSTRVPDGLLQKLTSLEELQINVHMLSDESKRQFLKDLGNLSQLRVLSVPRIDGLNESLQAELSKSLGNLRQLQHLVMNSYNGLNHFMSYAVDAARLDWDKAVFPEHVRHLHIDCMWFPCVPSSFINPNLSYLHLYVNRMDEAGLRALGGLPVLGYLCIVAPDGMPSHKQATVVNIAAHDVFFHKLRCLRLFGWMVQLAANNGASLLSIWREGQDAMVFDSEKTVARAPVLMPDLQELWFNVPVRALYKDGDGHATCLGLDLECLPSLRFVKACLDCKDASADDVNKAEAELRRAAELHPSGSALRLHAFQSKLRG